MYLGCRVLTACIAWRVPDAGAGLPAEGTYQESQSLKAHENDVRDLLCPRMLVGFRRQVRLALHIEGPWKMSLETPSSSTRPERQGTVNSGNGLPGCFPLTLFKESVGHLQDCDEQSLSCVVTVQCDNDNVILGCDRRIIPWRHYHSSLRNTTA